MKLSKLSSILIFSACGALPAFSATLTVNNGTNSGACPAQYTSIQAAVNAAHAGDTVFVCAGTYNEQPNVATNITLAGQTGATIAPSNMIVNATDPYDGTPIAAVVLVSNATVTVSGFIVDGVNNGLNNGCGTDIVGILYLNAGGTIAHNAVRNITLGPGLLGCQAGFGIYAGSNSGTPSVTITSNSVHNYQKGGVLVTPVGNTINLTLQANTIHGLGSIPDIAQNGVEIDPGVTGSAAGNVVSDNIWATCTSSNCQYVSTDILVLADNYTVSQNAVTNSQVGIYYMGAAAIITKNNVSSMLVADGIFLQNTSTGHGGTVSQNTVTDSPVSIEFFGAQAASFPGNTLIEAQVGFLNDNATPGITTTGTKFYDIPTPIENGAATHRKLPVASAYHAPR